MRTPNIMNIGATKFTLPFDLCAHLQNVSRSALARTSIPYTKTSLAISSILLRQGMISNVTLGNLTTPEPTIFQTLPPSQKRIWLGLKYRGGLPVLRNMSLISKPSKRVHVTNLELGRILTGRRAVNVAGVGVGEILMVHTDEIPSRVMEGWEAWRAGHGGELIIRCS